MLIRSDILLSVNILTSIIEQPKRAEVTAVTHCTYPLAHTTISGKIGVNGAMDFVKDILALFTQWC